MQLKGTLRFFIPEGKSEGVREDSAYYTQKEEYLGMNTIKTVKLSYKHITCICRMDVSA